MAEWISVKDRLPERSGNYLVVEELKSGGKLTFMRWFNSNIPTEFTYSPHVTHWMPLPEPPKEDDHA